MGLRVALATDIPRAVNFDGLPSIAVACAAACGCTLHGQALMKMRTRDAAASVGADKMTGSIEPDKRADMVIRTPTVPGVDVLWETAALSESKSINAVLVNGAFSVRDGELVNAEIRLIRERAVLSAQRVLNEIGFL